MLNSLKRLIPQSIKQGVKSLIYKGDKHICPFCGFHSRSLSPIGYDLPVLSEKKIIGSGRRPGGCYKCGSIDRERLIYLYLKHHSGIFSNSENLRVLHIAPELKITEALLELPLKEYICGDLFTEGYSYPKHVFKMNVVDLPFEEGKFDFVICNHVLEHVPDDIKAMNEIYRVLKNGGTALLQVPVSANTEKTFEDSSVTTPSKMEEVFGQFDHVRIYGQDYSSRLESVGFRVKRENFSHKYPKYGLIEEEDVYIINK